MRTQLENMCPNGQLVEPEEVGYMVSFLCGRKSRMVTGQCIALDGGYTTAGYGRLDEQ